MQTAYSVTLTLFASVLCIIANGTVLTSARYMWGLYPVAGQSIYLLTTPIFKVTNFKLESGSSFKIKAVNLSERNTYIQYAALNGKLFRRAWLSHKEIMNGGTLILSMGPKPSGWGSENLPPSFDQVTIE